jgi:hypothetical protein
MIQRAIQRAASTIQRSALRFDALLNDSASCSTIQHAAPLTPLLWPPFNWTLPHHRALMHTHQQFIRSRTINSRVGVTLLPRTNGRSMFLLKNQLFEVMQFLKLLNRIVRGRLQLLRQPQFIIR